MYAARSFEDESPVLVIWRCDGSYVVLNPSGEGTQRASMHVSGDDVWRDVPVLQDAKYIGVGWMHIREGITP